MNTRTRIMTGLCAAALTLGLTACGGKKETSIDVAQLSKDLQATISTGSLGEVSEDIIASTYFLDMDKIEEASAALNSGASACEVAVVKCSDSSYVSEAEELFETYVDNRSTLFASYNAPEVEKLDAALIKSSGNYVVLCVTDDTDAAEAVLKEAGF